MPNPNKPTNRPFATALRPLTPQAVMDSPKAKPTDCRLCGRKFQSKKTFNLHWTATHGREQFDQPVSQARNNATMPANPTVEFSKSESAVQIAELVVRELAAPTLPEVEIPLHDRLVKWGWITSGGNSLFWKDHWRPIRTDRE